MTVVFTDAAGFTVLARENEPRALRLLAESQAVFQEVFPKHRGQILKSTGDGVLSIFGSSVDAVTACLEVQERLKDSSLKHRIGIEAGEVTLRDRDAYGDAVNMAARLEQSALPGQIWVSALVHDMVRAQNLPAAQNIGLVSMKGYIQPVQVYAWGDGIKPKSNPIKAPQIALIGSSVAVLSSMFTVYMSLGRNNSRELTSNPEATRRMVTAKQYSEGEDIDALMDEAFVQVMDEMEAYEEVKEEARAKLDATPVIEFLASSPLGKRERGQRELEHWSLVQMAIEKGRIAAGQKANASEIINALSKSKDSTVKLALKAFDDEF